MSSQLVARDLCADDYGQLDEWLAAEQEHAHVTHEDFLGENRRGIVVRDGVGVVIWCRLTKVWRADIQFNNGAGPFRIARAMHKLVEHCMELARGEKIREFICCTDSKPLADMMQNEKLGFWRDPTTLRAEVKEVD